MIAGIKTLPILGVLLLSVASLACGAARGPQAGDGTTAPGGGGEPKYGGILTLATRADPAAGFDTMRVTNFELSVPGGAIYGDRNLVKPCREDNDQVCPGLAERWESNQDFTQWTFKVRDGVLWHDGRPFSAEDAKFWIDLAVSGAKVGDKTRLPSVAKAQFGPVKQVEVLAGNTVKVTLTDAAPIYPTLLAMFYPMLIQHPKHLMESRIQAGDVNVSPQDIGWVGAGPFKVSSYEKGSALQLRRFDGYWETDASQRKLPFLDGIDYIIFSDPSAMDAAFRTGRLDGGARGAGYTLSRERRAAYEKSLGDKVWFAEVGGGTGVNIGFNMLRQGPAQDVRVRRAISLWLDRKQAIDALSDGPGAVATFVPPTSHWPNPDLATWPGYNPATREKDRAEAKRLMQEAGYGSGLKLKDMCRKAWAANCEWFAGQLQPLGIQVDIDLQDDATYQDAIKVGNWDLAEAALTGSYPEALEVRMTTRSLNASTQVPNEDPRVAQLFARMGRASQVEERQSAYRELERYMLLDQVYAITTFRGSVNVPYRSYVKGVYVPLDTLPTNVDFATVWLDK